MKGKKENESERVKKSSDDRALPEDPGVLARITELSTDYGVSGLLSQSTTSMQHLQKPAEKEKCDHCSTDDSYLEHDERS